MNIAATHQSDPRAARKINFPKWLTKNITFWTYFNLLEFNFSTRNFLNNQGIRIPDKFC